jgi:hypothetical protein
LLLGAAALVFALAGRDLTSTTRVRPRSATIAPPQPLTARRLHPRANALPRGTIVSDAALFGQRAFANAKTGFALANGNQAQYPALTQDGGQTWRIDGPQFHVDAADGPEGVGYVGIRGPRTLFAYGSSVVDVTTNGGRTWWETFMGELVTAVVPGLANHLVAYVQQSVSNSGVNPAITWQYVSRDGGRHWRYSSALGGG